MTCYKEYNEIGELDNSTVVWLEFKPSVIIRFMSTEKDTQRETVAALRYLGWFVRVFSAYKSVPSQFRDFSDVLAVYRGNVLFLEFKAPKGKLSEGQERFADKILEHSGSHVRYLTPRTIEEVISLAVEMMGQ